MNDLWKIIKTTTPRWAMILWLGSVGAAIIAYLLIMIGLIKFIVT